MDSLKFAELMIEYERHYRRMKDIEELITPHVMKLEKSQSVANVTARYSGGRKVYDYEMAGSRAPKEIIEEHTELIRKTDWRKVCEDAGVDEIPLKSIPTPSVKIIVE